VSQVVLISLGARDRLCVNGAEVLAAHAGVSSANVVQLKNLAERALHREPELAEVFAGSRVVGCSRPRAARALLAFAGVALSERIDWLALPFDREALKSEYGVPWYPVIDQTRCVGCGTCHDYCLFSVYARDGKTVRVAAPLNCKTGCPACSRLCPEGALIFPFCHEAELNGEVEQPVHRSADVLAEALGDDPLRLLAERREKKRLIDAAKFEKAEKDRVTYSGVL